VPSAINGQSRSSASAGIRWNCRPSCTGRSDPRFGDTTDRLTNILRSEPPIELFEVLPGFRIEN
jgi:hypothetical protein